MGKKSFFRRRTPAKIQGLDLKVVESSKNLSRKIEALNSRTEGIIINGDTIPLTPPIFSNMTDDVEYASRMALRGVERKGDKRFYPYYVGVQQPRSIESAVANYRAGRFPFRLRNKSLFDAMKNIPEEDNFNVGFMYFPITGNNKSPIMVLFWGVGGGNVMDVYSQRMCKGETAGTRVLRDYAPIFILKVPSTEKKKGRYTVKFHDVPTRKQDDAYKAVIGWNTKPAYGIITESEFQENQGEGPLHELYTEISHEGKHRRGETFGHTIVDPHAVAAWSELLRESMRQGDYSPWEMSQYPLLSREDAAYWNKLNNNLLVAEKTKGGTYVLKHPRIDQLSVLMARRVGNRIRELKPGEVQETIHWDAERDGKISQYPVLPGEE